MRCLHLACLCAALVSSFMLQAEESCLDPDAVTGARYRIASSDAQGGARSEEFVLLRQTPSRLIYLLPDSHMTQIYERYGERKVKLIEYFDLESIGVEHEPGEVETGEEWDAIYQLFPAARTVALTRGDRSSYRCLATVSYAGTDAGAEVKATLIPALELPLRIHREQPEGSKTWELQELVTDRATIAAVNARVEGYRSYDFADLGDSEHEEFFRRSRYLQYKLGHAHD